MKRKPKVGEQLFTLNVGSAVSSYSPQKLEPVTVSSVGRKYFTVTMVSGLDMRFELQSWKQHTEHNPVCVLYETEQAWIDEKEIESLCRFLWASFEYGCNRRDLTLPTLREIARLVGHGPLGVCGYRSWT